MPIFFYNLWFILFHAIRKCIVCRALFTTTLHSREKTDVLLPGVSSNMMNLLLEYAYLRSINVNSENVCQLLVTADYLNILGVLDLCCEYLKSNLAPENCISVMRFAREHSCKGLESSAYRYVMRHFVQVVILALSSHYRSIFHNSFVQFVLPLRVA